MCGLIGVSAQVTPEMLEQLRRVILGSAIRGRHASGLVWHDGHRLRRLVVPGPADELLDLVDLRELVRPDGSMRLIGHTRYSTSALGYDQPLMYTDTHVGSLSVAHNGVVTQADPEDWERQFGLRCEGRNDSELILRALVNGLDPFEEFPRASVALVWLEGDRLRYGRNRLRPLWRGAFGSGEILASTEHILRSAGIANPVRVEPRGTGADLQLRRWGTWTR